MKQVLLTVRIALRGSVEQFMAGRDAAARIATTDGLAWKIWLQNAASSEIGGAYLFRDRAAAEAYLNGAVIRELAARPEVRSFQSTIWNVADRESQVTRAPIPSAEQHDPAPMWASAGGE